MIRSSVSSEDVVDWRKWDGGRRRLQKLEHFLELEWLAGHLAVATAVSAGAHDVILRRRPVMIPIPPSGLCL